MLSVSCGKGNVKIMHSYFINFNRCYFYAFDLYWYFFCFDKLTMTALKSEICDIGQLIL